MPKLCVLYLITLLFVPVLLKPRFRHLIKRDVVSDSAQSCNSFIYCQGQLLETVQLARVYPDSKTFVDMSQRYSQNVTLNNFNNLMSTNNNKPSKAQIEEFINANFVNNSELINWEPDDFTSSPSFLDRIKDKEIRIFASNIIAIWPTLGRKVSEVVLAEPEKHSLIGVPNGFIIPGGRFKELYYWDSYFIIVGLLLSDMTETAKGMIDNFLYLVQKYGFVPNGARVYYLNRSQPPLLTLMAGVYFDKSQDLPWLKENIEILATELTYWIDKKTVKISKNEKTYLLAHYYSESNTPRPESYYEDVNTCAYFADESEKQHCYQGLKSGAESGWDFSSRWFFDQEGGVKTNLTHIDAQRVAPVDLNAFLCASFKRLASFYIIVGDAQNAEKWEKYSLFWLKAIEDVFYNEDDGIWYDYDLEFEKPRKLFFPSNFAPLWTYSYDLTLKEKYGKRAAKYFIKMNIDDFKGGIPTSLDSNNEQWDLPNAWPPLQEFVILGLWNTGDKFAKKIAKKSAERWIQANMLGYKQSDAMFEKYDSTNVGQYGGGGEYAVQTGFGWTNGVVLNLIDKFATRDDDANANDNIKD